MSREPEIRLEAWYLKLHLFLVPLLFPMVMIWYFYSISYVNLNNISYTQDVLLILNLFFCFSL